MDLQTGLVCLVLFLISAGVLIFISLGMKSKSYEEALAEQRSHAEGLTGPPPSQKNKKSKKAGKKAKEKPAPVEQEVIAEVKTKPLSEPDPEPQSQTKPHVEFVEPEAQPVPECLAKDRRKRKVIKVKPILVNKDDSSCSAPPSPSQPSPPPLNHFEETLPKDDVEIFKIQHAEELSVTKEKEQKQRNNKSNKSQLEVTENAKEQRKGAGKNKVIEESFPAVVETVAPVQTVVPTHVAVPKANKKKKNELSVLQQMSGDRAGVSVGVLAPLISNAELSRSELQILIDLLLNKQHGPTPEHSEWSEGRSDPVQKLKKQLAEKEKALSDEQEASIAFQAKLRELRSELNTERSRLNALVRSSEESLAAKTTEAQALAAKLQYNVDSHNAEKHALAQQIQQIQKYNEEQLAARKLQEDQGANQEMLAQRQQYEQLIQKLKENEVVLNQQLYQLKTQLNETKNSYLIEAKGMQDEIAYRDSEMQSLLNQLEESRRQINEYEHQSQRLQNDFMMQQERLSEFAKVESEIKRLTSINVQSQQHHLDLTRKQEDHERATAQLSEQLVKAKSENEVLNKQIHELEERVKQQNGVNNHAEATSKVELINLQNELDTIRTELKQSKLDNVTYKTEVSEWTAKALDYENQTKTINLQLSQYKSQVPALETQIVNFKRQISDFTTKTSDLANKEAEAQSRLVDLTSQLEDLRAKNNDLRTKNWKVMEALTSTEKSLESKNKELLRLNNESLKSQEVVKEATLAQLQRLFPSISVPSKNVSYEAWLEEFSKKAQNKSSSVSDTEYEELLSEVNDLKSQNSQISKKLADYQQIIAVTENILKNLQSNVESKEASWERQLANKQEELDSFKEQLILTKESESCMNLEDDIPVCGVQFAYSCMEKSLPAIIAEMQNKLDELEIKLLDEQKQKQEIQRHYEISKSEWGEQSNAKKSPPAGNADFGLVEQLKEENSRLHAQIKQLEAAAAPAVKNVVQQTECLLNSNGPSSDALSECTPSPPVSLRNGQTGKTSKNKKKKSPKKKATKRRKFSVWFPKKLNLRRIHGSKTKKKEDIESD